MDNVVKICPFCEGEEGCCFCDYSGRVKIGDTDCFFKTEQDYEDSVRQIKTSYSYRYLNGNTVNPLKEILNNQTT